MRLKCGLIGKNIGRSCLSRALQIMCDDHGIPLTFEPMDTGALPDFDFEDTLARLVLDGWTGVTVTHPWKTHAAVWAGRHMAPGTESLGAANTLLFNPAKGFNTDYSGFKAAWAARMDQPVGHVAIAGAGGVARAIVPALIDLGARSVVVWDKDPARAEALSRRTGIRSVPIEAAPDLAASATGLVNCTPCGMAPDQGTAFDPAWIGPQHWAFDAVYTPTMTPFLRDARARGLVLLTGFDLFCFMAMESFAAYLGLVPDARPTLAKLGALKPVEA